MGGQTGMWVGPTLLLNAHPTCTRLPPNTSVVIAHGANDEVSSGQERNWRNCCCQGRRTNVYCITRPTVAKCPTAGSHVSATCTTWNQSCTTTACLASLMRLSQTLGQKCSCLSPGPTN